MPRDNKCRLIIVIIDLQYNKPLLYKYRKILNEIHFNCNNMDFKRCIDITMKLTKILNERNIDINITSIIIDYLFRKRAKQYENLNEDLKIDYNECSECKMAVSYYNYYSCLNMECQYGTCEDCSSLFKLNDITLCNACYYYYKDKECDCDTRCTSTRNASTRGTSAPKASTRGTSAPKASTRGNIVSCDNCNALVCEDCECQYDSEDDSSYCFECCLDIYEPTLSCVKCKHECATIPHNEHDTTLLPFFDNHICISN